MSESRGTDTVADAAAEKAPKASIASVAMEGAPAEPLIENDWFTEVDLQWPGQRTSLHIVKILFHEKSEYQVRWVMGMTPAMEMEMEMGMALV